MALTQVTYSMILGSPVNLLDYAPAGQTLGGNAGADTAALQSAMTAAVARQSRLVLTPPANGLPYLINDMCAVTLGNDQVFEMEFQGGAQLKRANGSIVNVDGDQDNFTPLIRVIGGSRVSFFNLTVDGNCNGQTYPTTYSGGFNIGAGVEPRRHCADVQVFGRVVAGAVVARPDVYFEGGYLHDAYMSAVATLFVGTVRRESIQSRYNTLNCFIGTDMAGNVAIDCYSYRDGVAQGTYTALVADLDRGFIQTRDFPVTLSGADLNGYTAPTITETLPCAEWLYWDGLTIEEACVIGVFARNYRQAYVNNINGINHGYARLIGGTYNPALVWLEIGLSGFYDNINLYAGGCRDGVDMPPYVLRLAPMDYRLDDTSSPYGKYLGFYSHYVGSLKGWCGEDWVAGGNPNDNANKKNNLYNIATVGSNTYIDYVDAEGTIDNVITYINESFYAVVLRPHDIFTRQINCRNHLGATALTIRQIGSPTGNPTNLGWGVINASDFRYVPDGSFDDCQIVLFTTAWTPTASSAGVTLDQIDCGVINFTGDVSRNIRTAIRLHCSNSSRIICRGGNISNVYSVIRSEAYAVLTVAGYVCDNINRLVYTDLSSATWLVGNAGTLSVTGNVCTGVVSAPYQVPLGPGGYVLSNLVTSGNHWAGAGNFNTQSSFTLGTSPLNYGSPADNDRMATPFNWVRSGAGAPSVNARYQGEIYKNTTGPVYYMAIAMGTGASDWVQVS
jgi:hypothetical protein